MRKAPIIILFVFFAIRLFIDQAAAQVPYDSLRQSAVEITTNIPEKTEAVENNENIMAMLDSLVSIGFFSNTGFVDDTLQLNVHGFAPDYVPGYPDSVIISRLEKLNLETIIDINYNKYVRNYIDVYAVNRRGVSSRVLGLAEVYFPLFEEYLDKYGMPLELKYLAVVESALNPTANSRAGAKGLWQFMYGTGKLYGLKVTSLVDDRFDPIKATDAACRHLKDLYNIYGDWSLALAAYNSGAGNVNKAIRRAGGAKSYWAIWPYLPRETRGYVPAFIAVAYIMNYPAEHNLYPVHPGIFHQQIDTVIVNDVLSFDQISEFLGISEEQLKFLNPAYKAGIIPSTKDKKYILRLPFDYVGKYVEHEQELYALKTKKGIEKEKLLAEIKKAEEQNVHVVRSGENLGLIAQKYRCSVNSLKAWNNLRNNTIHPGQKLVVYSPGYTSTPAAPATSSSDKPKITSNHGQEEKTGNISAMSTNDYIYYTVKKGDTLWDIARLYDGVSVEQIKKLNNIYDTKGLKPGQKLKVSPKG